jgi:hypothetical protein
MALRLARKSCSREDHFYGDRVANVRRSVRATHIEDVSPEQMEQRAAETMAAG